MGWFKNLLKGKEEEDTEKECTYIPPKEKVIEEVELDTEAEMDKDDDDKEEEEETTEEELDCMESVVSRIKKLTDRQLLELNILIAVDHDVNSEWTFEDKVNEVEGGD